MPPAPSTSNIRAFAKWREQSVYAGEEIECIITFKNIAVPPSQERRQEELETPLANGSLRESRRQSHAQVAALSRRSSIAQTKGPLTRAPSAKSTAGGLQGRPRRPELSLNVASAPSRAELHGSPLSAKGPNSAVKPAKGHGRSLSIMSLRSDTPMEGKPPAGSFGVKRHAKGHGKSASVQSLPKPSSLSSSHNANALSTRNPSPLYESTTPPAEDHGEPQTLRPMRKRTGTVAAVPVPLLNRQNSLHQSTPRDTFNSDFQFPPRPQPFPKSPSPQSERPPGRTASAVRSVQQRSFSPRPPEGWSGALNNLNPVTRVMSESSTTGTPRSSSEFYSMSNHSDETLTSEIPYLKQNGRLLARPSHSRQSSRSPQNAEARAAEPETLMMGYAQTMGHFTLDGSLVNAAPFEEVKRKGVQGGGGVIGVERSKRSSGMFGAFSWGTIGESLGGLLGGDEMSSIAQMKASAGSKSIPLLSTPQSLLFVDLRLAPGESRSYNFRFSLPRGLPPSHRGRAMKVTYHLALGIQRPGGQPVRQVQIPFRVLGSYNARGETLGHDLMSPYILLQDVARTQSIAPDASSPSAFPKFQSKESSNTTKTPKQGLEDFLRYTERLLEQPTNAHGALVSPTSPTTPRTQSIGDQPPSGVREAVDLAILRANYQLASSEARKPEAQSANRFNIARSGQPVAVLTLLRPAYRLGEPVVGTLDFTSPSPDSGPPPQSPTYSVLAELETAERVDPSLALRSSNSIQRVTRKVHASVRENTLFARQIGLNLVIPPSAAPTFETTGVSLIWQLRVEFTTQRHAQGGESDAGGAQAQDAELLEELGRDERGVTLIAREKLMAETFEIAVPLKVFGVPSIEPVTAEDEAIEV